MHSAGGSLRRGKLAVSVRVRGQIVAFAHEHGLV